jgi:peptidyl-dipeptidase A
MNQMIKPVILFGFLLILAGCLNEEKQAELILRHYIHRKVEPIRNYSMESAVALWDATVSGNESDYQKLIDLELNFNKENQDITGQFNPDRFYSITQNVFANQQDFELLQKLKYSGLITDTLLSRQLNVLYQAFMGPQIELEKYEKAMKSEMKLQHLFASAKAEIDGKTFSASKLDSIRKNTTDTLMLRKIYAATQNAGKTIAPDIVRLVKLRNETAEMFGYPDFYHLAFEARDQSPQTIKKLLGETEHQTRSRYFEAKKVIDKMLAKKFSVSVDELRAWHYNDDRTSYMPKRFTAKLDSLLAGTFPIERTIRFFDGIGLPVKDVFDNSRLEATPATANLTAMINVDFKNDIRLIAGITNSHDGLFRMMHLGGHASHYKSISDDIPYLLKTPNSIITEGIARYFEYLAFDYDWLKNEISADNKTLKNVLLVSRHLLEVDRLFKCRRYLAMAEFERELYCDPDQDLDRLWSEINLKYLGLHLPAEKGTSLWAANKYATSLSCTIHNFVLADIFAAQLQHSIKNNVIDKTNGAIQNNKAIGWYLIDNLYSYGNLLPWEELVVKATGEPLTPEYFAKQLIGEEYSTGMNN